MTLERSYRLLLRAYPARWRRTSGEEVLGCLLDSAEARGAARPSALEAADLLGHGLMARAGVLGGTVDARTREITATLAMASLSALASLCLFFAEWWPWPTASPSDAVAVSDLPGTPGPFFTAGGPLMVALLLPTLLSWLGRTVAARRLVAGLVPLIGLLAVAAPVLGVNRPALWALAGLLGFAVLSLLAPAGHRWLLLGAAAGIALALAYAVVANGGGGLDERQYFYYGYRLQQVALAVPLVVLAAVGVAASWRAAPAVSIVGACWLATFGLQLSSSVGDQAGALLYLGGAAGLCAVAALALRHDRITRDPGPAQRCASRRA